MGTEHNQAEADVLLAIRELGGWAKLESIASWLDGVQECCDIRPALQRLRKRGEAAYQWDGKRQRWGWVEVRGE